MYTPGVGFVFGGICACTPCPDSEGGMYAGACWFGFMTVASLLCLRREACIRILGLLPTLRALSILRVLFILFLDGSREAIGLGRWWRRDVVVWVGCVWV